MPPVFILSLLQVLVSRLSCSEADVTPLGGSTMDMIKAYAYPKPANPESKQYIHIEKSLSVMQCSFNCILDRQGVI